MDSSAETVVGRIGWVTTHIPGTDRAGEVSIQIRGGTETFLAYSDEEIPRGSSIMVTASRGARGVDVTPFLG